MNIIDELKSVLNVLDNLTPVIAYVALLISLGNIWLRLLRPFSLDYNFGSLHLTLMKQNSKQVLMIGVPTSLYNKGAKSGYIENISFKMKKVDADDIFVIYKPYLFYDSEE